MEREEDSVFASVELWISVFISARHKKMALDQAEHKINAKTIQLNRIEMAGPNGSRYTFKISGIKYVEWYGILATEYSQRYRVNGRIEMLLAGLPEDAEPGRTPPLRGSELTLPVSPLENRPVLMIPTAGEKYFAQVRRQWVKWIPSGGKQKAPVR